MFLVGRRGQVMGVEGRRRDGTDLVGGRYGLEMRVMRLRRWKLGLLRTRQRAG
jgi:hypothetical protein